MINASHDYSIIIILIPTTIRPDSEMANVQDPSELCMGDDMVKIRSDMVLRIMIESDEFRPSYVYDD
jgi:hypothetical protein